METYEAIKKFHTQFSFTPKIENAHALRKKQKFLVAGMGGSHLAADLLKIWRPEADIIVHSDYGLPPRADLHTRLIIISSYSGNTEEALNAFREARKRSLPLAAVSVGGKLIARAKRNSVPYVQLPDMRLEPRSALGLSIMALLAVMGDREGLREAGKLARELRPAASENEGITLARTLAGKVPVIYSSAQNAPIAYNWKIKFNENGKIPAFMNVFPELNHNEMNGFDVQPATRALSRRFHFVFLHDRRDHPCIQKRMRTLAQLYRARKLPVISLNLRGENRFLKIFSSLALADWTTYYAAQGYGISPAGVPLVEKFKRLIK